MQIVDAQIHLWGTGLPSIPVHRQVTHFTPDEAIVLMDEAGVDAAVISPPPWDPRSTELALGAVKNYIRDYGFGAVRSAEISRTHRELERSTRNARSAVWVHR